MQRRAQTRLKKLRPRTDEPFGGPVAKPHKLKSARERRDSANEVLDSEKNTLIGIVERVEISPSPRSWWSKYISLSVENPILLEFSPIRADEESRKVCQEELFSGEGEEFVEVSAGRPRIILVGGNDRRLFLRRIIEKGDLIALSFRRLSINESDLWEDWLSLEERGKVYGAGSGVVLFKKAKEKHGRPQYSRF
jgi:hypothetical protein